MRTIAVIPARYSSKRLPGKPLVDLLGKPMIQRVYEQVLRCRSVDDVLVATDDERIHDVVTGFGGRAVMTSARHESGTDRVAEAAGGLGDTDLIVNVQGDEPIVAPEAIDTAVRAARSAEGAMATLKREIRDRERILDPNVVKVVTDGAGDALYFSRSPIPWLPGGEGDATELPADLYYEHVGLYVYPPAVLARLAQTPPVALERVERLEQLRALVHGIRIRVAKTRHVSMAVDTEEDLERVRRFLIEYEQRNTDNTSTSKNQNQKQNQKQNHETHNEPTAAQTAGAPATMSRSNG